jgi:hypothetical protein
MSKMIKTISVNKLEAGMYVNLPLSWMSHSFIKNKFLIGNIGTLPVFYPALNQFRLFGATGLTGQYLSAKLVLQSLNEVFTTQRAPRRSAHPDLLFHRRILFNVSRHRPQTGIGINNSRKNSQA